MPSSQMPLLPVENNMHTTCDMPQMKLSVEEESGSLWCISPSAAANAACSLPEARLLGNKRERSTSSFLFAIDKTPYFEDDVDMHDENESPSSPSSMKEELRFSASSSALMTPNEKWSLSPMTQEMQPSFAVCRDLSPQAGFQLKLRPLPSGRNIFDAGHGTTCASFLWEEEVMDTNESLAMPEVDTSLYWDVTPSTPRPNRQVDISSPPVPLRRSSDVSLYPPSASTTTEGQVSTLPTWLRSKG